MPVVLFVILIIIGVVALVGGIIWLVSYVEKKRTQALQVVAEEAGLEFSARHQDRLLETMQVFSLFNKGHGRKMKNVMTATTEIAGLSIFDYQYTTGGGQHQHVHTNTVVAMESDSLTLPAFKLRPEGLFDKIGSAIGLQDIDFAENAAFSKMFVLQGDNEPAIRTFFDNEMLEFLTTRKGCYIECRDGVFIYLRGGRKKPEQIHEFMQEGYAVYTSFVERIERS